MRTIKSLIYWDILSYGLKRLTEEDYFHLMTKPFTYLLRLKREVCLLLPQHIIDSNSCKNIGTLIDEILRNKEIQFRWAIEAVNIESEEQSQALLREIVNL